MTKSEKKRAQIFVIVNFILFTAIQAIDAFTIDSQSHLEMALILCWLVMSIEIWKTIDMYDKKRVRYINLSILFLNIFYAANLFVPKNSIYASIVMYLGIIIILAIMVVFYKKYASKHVNHKLT
jgi:hypothetical protein